MKNAGPPIAGKPMIDFAELIAALRAGFTYVNVHGIRSGGEIRAQLAHD